MLLKYPTCCLHNLNVFMLLLDFIYCIKELLYHKHIKKRKRITIQTSHVTRFTGHVIRQDENMQQNPTRNNYLSILISNQNYNDIVFLLLFFCCLFVQFMMKYYNVTGHSICESNPCHNGARCEDMMDHFVCHCPTGYTGTRCQNSKL